MLYVRLLCNSMRSDDGKNEEEDDEDEVNINDKE